MPFLSHFPKAGFPEKPNASPVINMSSIPSLSVAFLALAASLSLTATSSTIIPRHESVKFSGPIIVESSGMANVHISYNLPLNGKLSLHYGDCDVSMNHPKNLHHHQLGETAIGDHPLAKRNSEWTDSRPERFVWLVPEDAVDGGCLFAYSEELIVGRSEKVNVVKRSVRRGIDLGDIGDAEGPWFDGVAYLKAKEPDSVFVSQAKSKSIGILGGGMSGLMSAVSLLT